MSKVTYTGESDIGKLRDNNEDAYIVQSVWDDKHILGVAIDGVGGYDGGERAAEIARESIIDYLEKYSNGERLDLLKQAVVDANNRIVDERNVDRMYPNMSCVLTACLVEVEKKQINMVHVGDTRLYQCRNELEKLSHDHSMVGYREEIGDLTEEEAMKHPQRNLISRMVGDKKHKADDPHFLEAATFPLLPNSTLLLCSDGLCDMLTSAEMKLVLRRDIPLEEKAQKLIDFANDKGGKDNITVVLIEYLCDEAQPNNSETENDSLIDALNEQEPDALEPKKQPTKTHPIGKNGWPIKTTLIALAAFLLGLTCGWLMRGNRANSDSAIEAPLDVEKTQRRAVQQR